LAFRNPDVIRVGANGKPESRLLYYWDTSTGGPAPGGVGRSGPITYPDGQSIGTIYNRDELTAALGKSESGIGPGDVGGHGTACAGVAAGNGRNSDGRYAGVAP